MAKANLGLTIGYGVSLAGGVLSLMIYARLLGPLAYGRLAVNLALVEAFQTILFQWHRLALVRYWSAGADAEDDSYLVTSHITWIVVAAIGGCAWLIVFSFCESDRIELLSVVLLALAKSAALYTQEIARASGSAIRYGVASLLLTLGATSVGVVTWIATRSMALTLSAMAAVCMLQVALCGYDNIRVFWRARFRSLQLRAMLCYGLPLVPVCVATTMFTRLDRPILASFEAARVVGVYAAASGLASNVISAACLLIVTPSYVWLLKEKKQCSASEHRALHARVGLLMLGGMLATCVILLLLGDVALPVMLGALIGVDAKGLMLPLLVIFAIGSFRTHFFDQSYHLHERTKVLMMINIPTLFVATAFICLGARLGGCYGMLIGLLIANIFSIILSAIFARHFVDMSRVMTGAASLIVIASLAVWIGNLSRIPMSHILDDRISIAFASTGIGILIFALLCVLVDIGSIRNVVARQL